MTKTKKTNLRYQCVEVLSHSLPTAKQQDSLSRLFPRHFHQLETRDQGLAKNICYGVFRHYYFLDALINSRLNKKPRKKDADILSILMASAYELLCLETPEHAVISESVELCKLRKKPWARALVNAFLRQLQRDGQSIDELRNTLLLQCENDAQKNLLLYEHPLWMIQQLETDWPDFAQSILEQNVLFPPMTLRVNKRFGSCSDYKNRLTQANILATQSPFSPQCLYLDKPVDVQELPGFFEGAVSVQDEAAQQAAPLLDIASGQLVLDACSAPGGKAAHLLELESDIDLLCLDIHPTRLQKLEQGLSRLKLHSRVLQADACHPEQWWDGNCFDRILLDAPCSASGIIRRNPDIKLHRTASDIIRLQTQQLLMLEKLWPCLKSGGLFLYATCSVFKQENQDVVEAFLEQNKDARLRNVDLPFGFSTGFGQQLLPQEKGHDGFFYALIEKNRGA